MKIEALIEQSEKKRKEYGNIEVQVGFEWGGNARITGIEKVKRVFIGGEGVKIYEDLLLLDLS